ncbi:MAG: hypothetical protein ABIJ09_08550 [Pseudomonadota bacterium]
MSMGGSGVPRGAYETASPLDGLTTTWKLVRGALRRHWGLALFCFTTTLGLAIVALALVPRQYLVEARLLTNPGYLIPSLAHPQRSVPRESQSATRGVTEQIKARDSLLALVDASELPRRWRETRIPVGRVLDNLREFVVGPLSPEDEREALVNMLDRRMWATIDKDSIVISVRWHDPETTRLLVETEVQQFLETRKQRELGEINDTIALLERSVEDAAPSLAAATAELESAIAKADRSGRQVRIPVRPRVRNENSDESQRDRTALEQELAGKRRAIQTLEARYQAALQRGQADLQVMQTTLGPQHPDVAEAVRGVERLSIPPQELTALRTDEVNLIQRLKSLDGSSRQPAPEPETPPLETAAPVNAATDPAIERATYNYRQAEDTMSDLSRRVANARMELASAQAAFSYRYIVTQPPILPRLSVSPSPVKFIAGGTLAGLFLALLFALLAEFRAGRVVEAWQLERVLDVRVLGEFEEP